MKRWGSVGTLLLLASCSGGSREVTPNGTVVTGTGPVSRVDRRTVSTPSDETPSLVTVSGRPPIPGVVTPGAPVAAMPSSGGYIVRSAGAVPGRAREGSAPGYGGASSGVAVAEAEPAAPPTAGGLGAGRMIRPDGAPMRPTPAVAPPRTQAAPRQPTARPTTTAATTRAGIAAADMEVMAPPAPSAATMVAPTPAPVPVGPGNTRITISVGPSPVMPPPPPPPVVIEDQAPMGGLLTAASVGDVDRRANYLEYLSRHTSEAEELQLDMTRRVRVRVTDARGRAVNAARLTFTGNGVNASALTHGDGVFDWYPSDTAQRPSGRFEVAADVEGVRLQATVDVPSSGDAQELTLRLPAVVEPAPPALDLAFAIDVTGSMNDELRYVNREIASIVSRVQAASPGVRVRVGSVFYRDRVDDQLVQMIPFTGNVQGFAAAMQGVVASGGGDYPEDMNAGLETAISRLTWSEGAATRVLVVIADAPPQQYPDQQFTYHTAMREAARRGIRILPVAASGANRTVEYLFRAMGAYTSTPYVYLTDDSGVGGSHMEADTDRVAVERFNDLLTRMVVADLNGQGMHEPGALAAAQ